MKKIKLFLSVWLILGTTTLNVAPVLALGEIPTPPPVVTIPADTTPPVISGVASVSVSQIAATIVWTTDELATSQLEYGTTQSYGSSATIDASALLVHSAVLTGLSAGTLYYYCIHAMDIAGNSSTSCGHSFTTQAAVVAPVVDTVAPIITGITAASVSSSEMTVAWTTNEGANSQVEYGLTSSYGSTTTLDAGLGLAHLATITNLTPDTEYHYHIRTADAAGNVATSGDDTFTTPAVVMSGSSSGGSTLSIPSVTAPIVSAVVELAETPTSEIITWVTDQLTDSKINYGTTSSYGSSSALDANFTTIHSVTLTGLTPNTTYHYQIKSKNFSGSFAVNGDEDFTTLVEPLAPGDTTPPVISGVAEASLLETDATIIWSTDELAVSSLEYGTTQSYGTNATLSTSALLAHSAIILNLSANTTYYYCIHATDFWGNTSSSCGHSFTTASTPTVLDANSPTISTVMVTPVTTQSATIHWVTDEVANGQIEYGLNASYGITSPFDADLSLLHTVTLSGLSPNTLYHYRINSSDEVGNVGVSPDNTFTTEAIVSTGSGSVTSEAAVVISGIETAEVSNSSTTIAWTTNISSDSQVEYGDSALFGQTTTIDHNLVTTHSVTIKGLAPDTNYYFRVKSKPLGVSVATISLDHEFNTLADPTPVIIPANITSVSGTWTSSSGTIVVTTDKVTTAQVEYGITTEYGLTSALDNVSQTNHSLALTDFVAATVYQYRVKTIDAEGNIIYSENYSFTTVATTSTGNTISSGSSSVSVTVTAPGTVSTLSASVHDQDSATLTWHVAAADTDATGEYDIRYSMEPIVESNFANAAKDQAPLVTYVDLTPEGTTRSYIIAGLNPGTTYYFALKSKFENSGYSSLSNVATVVLPSVVASDPTNVPESVSPPIVLIAAPADGQVILDFENSQEPSFVRTVVVERSDGYPTSPSDGQVVYEGNGSTFTNTNLNNGTTYYYSLYSYNSAKEYSAGVHVSLAPASASREVVINENPETTSRAPREHFVEVLKLGTKNIEVEHLQQTLALDEGLYPEKLITGYFGTLTTQALKRFQQKSGLPQTGVTDQATQAKLNEASQRNIVLDAPEDMALFTTNLRQGMQNEEVVRLQEFLVYEGSYKESVMSGRYDLRTTQAVKVFQKKYGVKPVSGYFGPKTRHKVLEITGL